MIISWCEIKPTHMFDIYPFWKQTNEQKATFYDLKRTLCKLRLLPEMAAGEVQWLFIFTAWLFQHLNNIYLKKKNISWMSMFVFIQYQSNYCLECNFSIDGSFKHHVNDSWVITWGDFPPFTKKSTWPYGKKQLNIPFLIHFDMMICSDDRMICKILKTNRKSMIFHILWSDRRIWYDNMTTK